MDLIQEFSLPSKGKIYQGEVRAEGRIRAPRLCDKGIGDLSRRNKIQAEVLNKTILDPGLGIDAYDLHVGDYTYLNLIQRIVSRGKDMKLTVTCPYCGATKEITIDLSEVKINPPKLPLDLTYETRSGDRIQLRFYTPRLLDNIRYNTEKFKEDFPDATQDVGLQESARALIVSVNDEKLTYSQMTNYLLNSYEMDLIDMVEKAVNTGFGPVLVQSTTCSNRACRKKITFSISPDNG